MTDLLDRYLAPGSPQPAGDPLDDELRHQQQGRAAAALITVPKNPDAAGEANGLARQVGLPADTVERNLPAIKSQQQISSALALLQGEPRLAEWITNPRHAAVSFDDLPRMARVGQAVGSITAITAPAPTAWNWVKGVATSVREGFRQVPLTFQRGAEDLSNWITGGPIGWSRDPATGSFSLKPMKGGPVSAAVQGIARSRATVDQAAPEFKSWWGRSVYGGVANLGQNVPGIAASVLTGGTAPALVMGSTLAGTQGYNDIRDAGGSARAALLGSSAIGAIEAATEFIPTKLLTQGLGKLRAPKALAEFFGKELLTEEIATVSQNAVQTAATPNTTWGQYLQQLPADMRDTAVATAITGLAVGGAGRIAHRVAGNINALDQASTAANGTALIDSLMAEAVKTKTRDRDPEAFRQFLAQHTDNTPAENLYLPAEKLREFFQSERFDPDDAAHEWLSSTFSDQMQEAAALGGDVVIPTAEAVARLAGSSAWDAIRGDVRLSAGGMSESEARTFETDYADHIEQQTAEMEAEDAADQEARAPERKVFDEVFGQLRQAGYSPDAANAYASLWSARYATRAQQLGTDALSAFQQSAVTIRQDAPAVVEGYRQADQMDLLINAMRGKAKPSSRGPSLLEWIAKRGGVEDRGGDVASMGGDRWHTEKAFRRRLIRSTDDTASFLPGEANANTPDSLALDAWEAGYFPDSAERPTANDLLDAIDGELRGSPRHTIGGTNAERETNEALATAGESLRAFLSNAGLDPDTATRADIDAAIASEESDRHLDQSARGRIDLFTDGRRVIRLFESRDLSTLIHESGHLWLEELSGDAQAADAPDQVKADWAAVQAWFKANGHDATTEIPTEAHELFARGFERYAMEGRSPSTALRRVFDRFRSWLLRIYQVFDHLHAPITPEIRAVFDRMLATEDEIAIAEQEQGLKALFTDAAQAGMTEEEFAAYSQAATEARGEAYDALIYRTMEAIRRQRTKEWKDEERGGRDDVTARINRRPEFQALHLLRTGKWLGDPEREGVKVRLDRQWLVETYGADALALLPKGVPPIYGDKATTSAEDIAEMTGFRSGDDLVRALMGIEQAQKVMREDGDKRSLRARLIDEETAAEMRERHGDPLNDGSIEEEALAAVHNGRQGELIASEARALARRSGGAPTPLRLAREWARRRIGDGKVVDVASRSAIQRYARAAAKAARAAETAILAGDIDETYRQKQAQLLNHALLTEAKIAADEVDAAVKRLSSLANRRTIASVDQDYLDRAHALLEKFDLRPRSQRAVSEQASFAAWADQQRASGVDVVTPPRLESEGEHFSRIGVDELRSLRDSVEQIIHLGRFKQKLIDAKEQRDFDEVVAEAVDGAGNLRQKPPSDLMEPSFGDRLKAGIASIDGALLKMETIFDWLDGGKADGVFNRVAFRPIAEAQDRENDMLAEYYDHVKAAISAIAKGTLKRWPDKVTLPELINRETGRPWALTRQTLVSMALNMGNAGNIQRLTDGYGWNEQSVRDVLNRELTAEEWKFAQRIWDIFDTLWPQIEGMERRINGFAPEKVAAVLVETPHGTFAGGYFPAVYDTTKSLDAEANAAKAGDLFETTYTRATTRASATNERTDKVVRPILLNLGVINRHLGETIHDITHREAVMNADRFLSSRRVMAAVDQSLGPEIRKQFRPWLKFVANRWASERAGNEGLGKLLAKARANTTIVGMGFRFTTVVSQLAGYSNSAEYVGAGRLAAAIAATSRHPVDTFRFVMERSGEVRHRMDTLDRDIGVAIRQMSGKSDPLTAAKRFAFHGIGYMDRVVVIPTWIAGYNKALAAGATEEQATYEGDKAVRLSQGAGSAKDLAAVQRGTGKWGEVLKLMTMFYSYLSALYQRERTFARDATGANAGKHGAPDLVARAWWLFAVPPILTELLSGRGPDADEDWGWWAFEKMIANALAPIPLVRDVFEPALKKMLGGTAFNPSISPLQRSLESVVNTSGDVGKIARGEPTAHATKDVLETAGYTTGLVPGQFASASQFLVDIGQGDQDPETLAEWYRGLTTGKAEKRH